MIIKHKNTKTQKHKNTKTQKYKNTKKIIENKVIFIIPKVSIIDWRKTLFTLKHIGYVRYIDNDTYISKYIKNHIKLLPLDVNSYTKYNRYKNNIFKNNLDNIDILENKSKFCKYMIKYFYKYIPKTYYYNFDNETYINNSFINNKTEKLIQKDNYGFSSHNIKIVYNIELNLKNHIIQKYIEHKDYYVGHFLVLNGIILDKIYFYSNNNKNKNGILKGAIQNYQIKNNIKGDTIFNKILKKLDYSGFACADFIINNNKILIFEINPRIGGSLIHNKEYFIKFLNKLYNLYKNKN
jgi:hypothetical protein